MQLELFFATSRYNSIFKAQHLTALLPTEILQNLGPKIVTIVNLNKSDCDYFSEIRNLVKDFYKPSKTALFDKYFCKQSLGLLTSSQFFTKIFSDLKELGFNEISFLMNVEDFAIRCWLRIKFGYYYCKTNHG